MENAKFEAYKKKLQGICDENNLVFRLRNDGYPITLTIAPVAGLDEQMTILGLADEQPFNSPDAKIIFSIEDGALTYKMSERFTISDTLFGKIKNLFKNLHYTFLQYFHRECIEKLLLKEPVSPSCDSLEEATPIEDAFDPDDLEEGGFPEDSDTKEISSDSFDEPEEEETMSHEEYLRREAIKVFKESRTATCTTLRNRLNIGFAEGAKILNALEDDGIIHRNKAGELVLTEDACDGSDEG